MGDVQGNLFDQQPIPRPPRRGTFAEALARADARETPPAAADLPPGLQRLARLCKTLSEDAAGGEFTLGTLRAGQTVGGDSLAGSRALNDLWDAGLIQRTRCGKPGEGCSRWVWTGDYRPALPWLCGDPTLAGAEWN